MTTKIENRRSRYMARADKENRETAARWADCMAERYAEDERDAMTEETE